MLIFGISTKDAAKTSGRFHCPVCDTQRTYAQLVRKRRFTLFFIPVLPLGSTSLGRVRCTHCGSEFNKQAVTG